MTTPSYSNIDHWLFDYIEGNLSDLQVFELERFILENPELEIDLEAWEDVRIYQDENHDGTIAAIINGAVRPLIQFPVREIFVSLSVAALFCISALLSNPSTENSIASIQPTISIKESRNSLDSQIAYFKKLNSKKVENTTELEFLTTSKSFYSSTDESNNQSNEKSKNNSENNSKKNVSNNFGKNLDNNLYIASRQTQKNNLIESKKSLFTKNEFHGLELTDFTENEVDNSMQVDSEYLPVLEKTFEKKSNKVGKTSYASGKNIKTFKLKSKQQTIPKLSERTNSTKGKTVAKRAKDMRMIERFSKSTKAKLREIKRMMDNPIALKNTRNPNAYLPGSILQDVNFGFTGSTLPSSLTTQTRLQWMNFNTSQIQSTVNYSQYIYGIRGGIGIQANNQYYGNGLINSSELAFTYSPKISISKNFTLEPSARLKMGRKTLNLGTDKYDQSLEIDRGNAIQLINTNQKPIGGNLWFKDMGVGLLTNTKWFYFGAQVDNVFRHFNGIVATDNKSNDFAFNHITVCAGTEYENLKKTFSFAPNVIYNQNGKLNELWFGASTRYRWIQLNANISSNKDFSLGLSLIGKRVNLSYTTDYLKSSANVQRGISHQISLKISQKRSRIQKQF